MFIHLDSLSFVVLHTHGLEVQTLHIGSTAGSCENLIHCDLFFSSPAFDMDDFAPIFLFDSLGLTVEDQADSVTDEGLLENFCCIAVLAIQYMRGIVKESDLASQSPKCLSQFASNGSSPNNCQTPRPLGQGEDGLIGEKSGFG